MDLKTGAQASLVAIRERCAKDPCFWAFNFVRTRDEHDRLNPDKPFPDLAYLRYTLNEFYGGPPLQYVAKSRQLMISWALVVIGLHTAMHRALSTVLWQSKKEHDAAKMVYLKSPLQGRMSFVLSKLPTYMQYCVVREEKSGKLVCEELADKTAEPEKRMALYFHQYASAGQLSFPNGSLVMALAQGADQVESSVPTLYISDEASLQDEWKASQAAAQPAIDGDARGITVGTMRLPSDYGDEIAPCAEVDPDGVMRGVARFTSKSNVAGIRIHYSADPGKDPQTDEGQAWKAQRIATGGYRGGENDWHWQQHMEINPESRGGQVVLRALQDERACGRIVIPAIPLGMMLNWSFSSGLDWGKRNNAVWMHKAIDPQGRRYITYEIAEPGNDLNGIYGMSKKMKAHPLFARLNGRIQADPSLWNVDQNQDGGGIVSKAALFARYGVFLQAAAAKGEQADSVSDDRLNYYYWEGWEDETFSPLLFIFDTCPVTIQNFKRLRYDEFSDAIRPNRQQKETIRDLYTDEWDAFKYEEVQWHDIPHYEPQDIVGTLRWHRAQHAADQRKSSGDVFANASRYS